MAHINLLPWREERRVKAKRQFYVVLVGMAILGIGLVYLVEMNIQNQIDGQLARNRFIEQEAKKLDKEIAEIDDLKKQKEKLIGRMGVIQSLQGNRSVIVHHFDEIVRTVPDGVYFTRLEKKGSKFFIEGTADANNRVSNLMRNLSASDWFKEPNLTRVKVNDESKEESSSSFVLSVTENAPATVENSHERSSVAKSRKEG